MSVATARLCETGSAQTRPLAPSVATPGSHPGQSPTVCAFTARHGRTTHGESSSASAPWRTKWAGLAGGAAARAGARQRAVADAFPDENRCPICKEPQGAGGMPGLLCRECMSRKRKRDEGGGDGAGGDDDGAGAGGAGGVGD